MQVKIITGGSGLRLAAVLALAAGLTSCGSTASVPAVHAATVDTDVVPHSREANDLARFIAGLPSREGSPFEAAERSAAWQEHRQKLDATWKRAEAGFIVGLREFGGSALKQDSSAGRPLFYPFSGPDALTAVVCFPQNPVYVLAGLEPPGTLPTSAQIDKKNLPLFLEAIRESMSSELGRSFFVTREMDHRFRGQLTDGLLLPILFLLARTDHEILGLRPVRVNETGHVAPMPPDGARDATFRNRGLEIEFQGNGPAQRLYYFTVNLNDKRLGSNAGFQAYLTQLGTIRTLLKATSYMTHHPEFSIIRSRILAQSESILQDDSGIPYKDFDPAAWQVRLFGDYERPYGSFRWLEQPALRKAYQAPGVEPLPFHIGYGFHRIPSNLQLARRSSPAASARTIN